MPQRYSLLDDRGLIQIALRTSSLELAMRKRDGYAEADDAVWQFMALKASSAKPGDRISFEVAQRRHAAACARAQARGFSYRSVDEIAEYSDVDEIVARLKTVDFKDSPTAVKAEALLGGAPEPLDKITVSEAFDLYVKKIAFDDQYNKSPAQRYSWEKTKRTSINYFIEKIGDIALSDITREKAVEYRDYWQAKMVDPQKDGSKLVVPNTANRHIGNMRSLYKRYFKYTGKLDVEDPFRDFYFSGKSMTRASSD